MIQHWQRIFWMYFILNADFSLIFRKIVLSMKEKNTSFEDEKSALLISAEHMQNIEVH